MRDAGGLPHHFAPLPTDAASPRRATQLDPDVDQELLAAMREVVRTTVMTLNALVDPHKKYQGFARLPVEIVHDAKEAYGYTSARIRRFQPSAREISQMEVIAPWLAWLKREHGAEHFRRIWAWALGAPTWLMAEREGCTQRTVLNRIDRALCLLIRQFMGRDVAIAPVDEGIDRQSYAVIFDHPDRTRADGLPVKKMKIYIGGKGLWRGGKYLDNGHRKFRDAVEVLP